MLIKAKKRRSGAREKVGGRSCSSNWGVLKEQLKSIAIATKGCHSSN